MHNDYPFEVLTEKTDRLSRRDALKLIGLSPVAASVIAGASSTNARAGSDVQGKIVVVGGGAGGIMAMAHLRSSLNHPDITIIAPNDIHLYQPGQVFIAAGEYKTEDIVMHNSEFIPDDVNWIKDAVETFDPDHNKLVLRSGATVSYDYLVVATGMQYHYDWIEGLTKEDIGTNGISSVYLSDLEAGTADGGYMTWEWFKKVENAAKEGKKPRVIYTQPNTPIKCGGAPQKILYLSADYLKKAGLGADFIFATNGKRLFSIESVNKELFKTQKEYDTITNRFKHNLKAIDVKKKIATFDHNYEVKGEYDEDLEEYDVIEKYEEVKMEYDFIHIVPPMGPVDALVNSPLGWQKGSAKGWLEVDRETLQHRRYKNVFGIGDTCGIPLGKTGGSARHHAPIVAENLIAEMEHKALKAKFDGYTVCPLKPRYGEIIMAEFDYDGPAPTAAFMSDISRPRYIWWAFDIYMLKPMYKYLMMRGWF